MASFMKEKIEFYPEQMKFVGHDKIISKNKIKNLKYEIRFHLEPNIKIMKTQDNKSILIDLGGEGWKFNSDNNMNIDNGLYFGRKDSFVDNQNIIISGMTNDENQTIKWEITKTIMKKIKRALISVSNKKNLKDLLKVLTNHKVELISSGGTYKEIKKLKFKCLEVSRVYGLS